MTLPPNQTDHASGSEVASAADEIAGLRAEITALRELITGLQTHIAELERRLGLNSSNSGKPPSSDGLKKPARVRSLREPSGKSAGGQKGHPGKTLLQVETPDIVVDHFPEACARCGAALTAAMATSHGARQVFDLPGATAPRRHRASRPCLLVCAVRCANAGCVPGRGHGAGPIRHSDLRLRGLSPAGSFPAGGPAGRADA